MKPQIRNQTLKIDIAGAKALDTTIDYEMMLDSSYEECIGIEFLETVNSNNRDYDIRIAGEDGTFEDFAPREHFLALTTNAGVKSFLPIGFDERVRPVKLPCGKKIKIGIKHTVAMLAGETIQIKAICRLRAKQ